MSELRLVVDIPSARLDSAEERAAGVAAALAERADELTHDLHAVMGEASLSGSAAGLLDDARVDVCTASIRSVLAAMTAETDFDPTSAAQTGAVQARRRMALSSLIQFYRIAFRRLWDVVANEAAMHAGIDGEALRSLTLKLHAAEDLFMSAMVAGYREEQKRQLLSETSQRAFMIDSLLHGRILDDWNLWEVASLLRLPSSGPFVVIAAEAPAVGAEALPEIESKLHSLDVYSAWRLFPDVQVGIAHAKSDLHLDKVLALISRMPADRVGVSARFDDLRETPQALHIAKVTLRGRADRRSKVAVFDGSILATAAVSAPEVMTKWVGTALDCFYELPNDEREILFDTFRVWQENDASVRATAEVLICHPNTVRHRLRRIERRTGRSLSRPRDVAELCLAFEVHRLLM
jgi:PucR C-terminal helix-turn-helix domain/GGDEF-like domain